MSSLTTAISVQIDKSDKEKATIILDKLGVSMSGLINMTIKQLIMIGRIPFDIALPSNDNLNEYFTDKELDDTSKELIELEKNPNKYKTYHNVKELKESLIKDE